MPQAPYAIFGTRSFVGERHQHRYDVQHFFFLQIWNCGVTIAHLGGLLNPDMVQQFEDADLSFTGKDEMVTAWRINSGLLRIWQVVLLCKFNRLETSFTKDSDQTASVCTLELMIADKMLVQQSLFVMYFTNNQFEGSKCTPKSLLRISLVHPSVSFKIVDIERMTYFTCFSFSLLLLLSSGICIPLSSFNKLNSTDGSFKLSGYISGPDVYVVNTMFTGFKSAYGWYHASWIKKNIFFKSKILNLHNCKYFLSSNLTALSVSSSEDVLEDFSY
ncbi:hypothetical protein KY290_015218 [Solanum tuberosum]|uniref:Uncharacterized protein n=1 Tax=Solanum tuberosum TaxID=4113 RepID=A0ABQ7VRT6_SOLTU|nr:hypothetical protein KY290_015218 [Solanum tuberosum]